MSNNRSLTIELTNQSNEIFRGREPRFFLILVVPKAGFLGFGGGEDVFLGLPEYQNGKVLVTFNNLTHSLPISGKIYVSSISSLQKVKAEIAKTTNYNEYRNILQLETKLENGDKYNISLQRTLY